MSMNIMQLLQRQVEKPTFSEEELRAAPKDYRKYIAASNSVAIMKPEGFDAWLAGRKITPKDKDMATRISQESVPKAVSHIRSEAFLQATGGSQHFTPEVATLKTLTGAIQKRANAVIPAPYGVAEVHANVQHVTALVTQFIKVKDASWKNVVPINTWKKVIPPGSNLQASSFVALAENFCEILNESRVWKAMDVTTRNACQGPEMLSFVRGQLDQIPREQWDILNTRIVFDVLRPMVNDGTGIDGWMRLDDEHGRPVVPISCYREVQASDFVLDMLEKENYPGCYWYFGGFNPLLNVPANTGRFKETLDTYMRMTEIQVGNNSTTAILAGMRDYSGLTDDFGKRIQFYLGAVLGVWALGKPADVKLYTVGDLPMLLSSLNTQADRIKLMKDLPFRNLGDVKFVLPSEKDMSSVSLVLRKECLYEPRVDSVLIVYQDLSLPTSDQKDTPIDYHAHAKYLFPPMWSKRMVVSYQPVYDEYYFPSQQTDDDKLSSKLPKEHLGDQFKVLTFGIASNFRGIVTNLQKFQLWGYGYEKISGKWNMSVDETYVPIPTVVCPSFKAWMMKVHADCLTQMVAFMRPMSRYSPISNLVSISKKGVQLTMSQAEAEDGVVVANVSRIDVRTTTTGSRIHRAQRSGNSSVGVPANKEPATEVVNEGGVLNEKVIRRQKRVTLTTDSGAQVTATMLTNSPVVTEDEPDPETLFMQSQQEERIADEDDRL